MEITNIKIKKFDNDGKMKAIASITFDECFAIHDIKVIENEDKVFVAMPNKKLKDGTPKKKGYAKEFTESIVQTDIRHQNEITSENVKFRKNNEPTPRFDR